MSKSNYFFLIISILFSNFCNGQTLNWQWAKSGGGIEFEYATAIKSDAIGNTYVVGRIYSITTTFGPFILNNADPLGAGSDAFLAKYDPSGNVLWVRGIGGIGNEYGYAVTLDSFDNVYITGSFESPTMNLGNQVLTNALGDDAFVIKYNSSGDVVWARNISCNSANGQVIGYGIAADNEGNILVTGQYTSDTLFFGNTFLTNSYYGNFFIAKMDSSGNPIWAKIAGGNRNDRGSSVSTDNDNNIYVTGNFQSSMIIFDADSLIHPDSLATSGIDCTFLVKYDANGNLMWTKKINGYSSGSGVTNDVSGNIYWAGTFIDSITIDNLLLTDPLSQGVYVIKFHPDGNIDWATSPQGTYTASCNSVSIDQENNIYITGDFDTGPMIFGNTVLTRSQASNLYLAKYDSSGHPNWALKLSGWNEIGGRGVSNDGHGNVYLTGIYRSTDLNFDSILIVNNLYGSSDIFVAKLHESLVSINEISENNYFTIYPNPIIDNFKIQCKDPINLVLISDIEGQIILLEKIFK